MNSYEEDFKAIYTDDFIKNIALFKSIWKGNDKDANQLTWNTRRKKWCGPHWFDTILFMEGPIAILRETRDNFHCFYNDLQKFQYYFSKKCSKHNIDKICINNVPNDLVLWGNPHWRTFYLSSKSQKMFVKCSTHDRGIKSIDRGIHATRRTYGTRIRHHVPEILNEGTYASGGGLRWMQCSLFKNTDSLPQRFKLARWLRLLEIKVMPALWNYYEDCGLSINHSSHILHEFKVQLYKLGNPEIGLMMLEKCESYYSNLKYSDYYLIPQSFVHGDLNPKNYISNRNEWWLIDWSGDEVASVCSDVMGLLITEIISRGNRLKWTRFVWNWINGPKTPPPQIITRHLQLWNAVKNLCGIKLSSVEYFKFELLIVLLEWYIRNKRYYSSDNDFYHLAKNLQLK